MTMERQDIGNKSTITLKLAQDFILGGTSYSKGEVFMRVSDVSCKLLFKNASKSINGHERNIIDVSAFNPDAIVVNGIGLRDSIMKLIGVGQNTNNFTIGKLESIESVSGIAYCSVFDDSKAIFVYDENKVKVTGYTLDGANGQILGLADGTYAASLEVYKTASLSYEIKTVSLPHFKIEIDSPGNLDGVGSNLYIVAERCSLLINPEIDLGGNKLADTLLVFSMIPKIGRTNYKVLYSHYA